jgi:hypothetical protein
MKRTLGIAVGALLLAAVATPVTAVHAQGDSDAQQAQPRGGQGMMGQGMMGQGMMGQGMGPGQMAPRSGAGQMPGYGMPQGLQQGWRGQGSAMMPGQGRGPGMMGPGMMGPGMMGQGMMGRGGYGPGLMMDSCPGYGAGAMTGPRGRHGMTGHHGMMGRGMGGYGMMGPGRMAPGGQGVAPGYGRMGPGMAYGPPALPEAVSPEDVRGMLEQRLAWHANPNIEVGEVVAEDGRIRAEIVTVDGSLVYRWAVDPETGRWFPAN